MQPPPAAPATPATPKLSFAQTLAHGTPQAMLYLLVLDFEATCDENRGFGPQEVIEFPTVVINTCTLQKEAEFHSYVRPVRNRKLTPFCTSLTGITQEQVDPAPSFPEVWEKCVSRLCIKTIAYSRHYIDVHQIFLYILYTRSIFCCRSPLVIDILHGCATLVFLLLMLWAGPSSPAATGTSRRCFHSR